MIFLRRTLFAVALGVCAVSRASADEGWVIERLEILYDIQPDGSVIALDAVDVDFRGLARHGIYRDLQYLFSADATHNREYPIDLIQVTAADGRRHRVKKSRQGSIIQFKIGDPDRTISGRESYRIQYRIGNALNSFADHEELYWNATGAWPVTMKQVAVVVKAPAGAVQRVACFQGAAGSKESCRSDFTPEQATFIATRPLDDGEQLTIVTGLRKGAVAVAEPRLVEKPHDIARFFDRSHGLVSAVTLIGMGFIGGLALLWWEFGRDRRYVSLHYLSQDATEEHVPILGDRPIAVEFQPPERIRPAQVGLLIDERADTLDVTATIVDLAVRGYLSITELPKDHWFSRRDWRLDRLKDPDDALLPYEKIILVGLFSGQESRDVSELKNKFYEYLNKAKKALYSDAVDRRWFPRNPNTVRLVARWFGIVVFGGGILLTFWLGQRWGAALAGIPVVVAGLLVALMARAMPRRTAAGREMMRRSLGFARYLRTAETHQQEFAERANIFTEYLPYAVAFKCVTRWARAFKDIDLQAATAGWYAGTSGFDPGSFSSGLGSLSSSLSSAMSSTPGSSGSSGFGGGGSSGGGGGGGGGGSW